VANKKEKKKDFNEKALNFELGVFLVFNPKFSIWKHCWAQISPLTSTGKMTSDYWEGKIGKSGNKKAKLS